jgi:hypothetical protein
MSNFLNIPNFDPAKLFQAQYWLEGTAYAANPVQNNSFYFWIYIVAIALLVIFTIILGTIKMYYIDTKSKNILDNEPQNAYQITNPVYNSISFYQTWYTIIYIILALYFIFRQFNIFILNSRVVLLFTIGLLLVASIKLVLYYFTKRKLDVAYFEQYLKDK